MRTLLKAIAVVLGVCLGLFIILTLAGVEGIEAAKLVGPVFSLVAVVDRKIEERSVLSGSQPRLQTLSDFSLPPWKAFLLAAISAFALMSAVATFGGALINGESALVLNFRPDVVQLAAAVTVPINLYIVFAAGQWIGIRSENGAYVAAGLAGSLVRLADSAVSLLWVAPETYKAVFGHEKTNFSADLLQIGSGTIFFGFVCLMGCWRGSRHRQAWYIDHLLKSVAPETRAAIIDLAYEEAQKTITRRGGLR